MLQGMNNSIDVIRRTEGVDDAVGGLVNSGEATVYAGLLCRVDNPRGSRREAMMGIDLARAVAIVVAHAQPQGVIQFDIRPNDLVLVKQGPFAGKRFLVRDVREDSLGRSHPRAHVELTCERVESARSKP
jgi:hypothetical protein